MSQLFTNNASSTLVSPLTASALDVTIEVQSGEGTFFPNPPVGDFFMVTLEDAAGNIEICKCTARDSDLLTVQRAQENTSLRAWASGDRVECRLTAGTFDEFLQRSGGTLTGDLDINGFDLTDPVIQGGEARGTTLRGSDGGTSNQLVVPAAGDAPTIGGNDIWHAGNDGPGSGLNADLLDGHQATYFEGLAADADNLVTGTLSSNLLDTDVAFQDQKNGWSAGEYTAEINVTASSTTNVDADLSNCFDISMGGVNISTLNINNFDNGQTLTLLFRQSTSPSTCNFPSGWRWARGVEGELTSSSSAHDIVCLVKFNGVVYATMLSDFS